MAKKSYKVSNFTGVNELNLEEEVVGNEFSNNLTRKRQAAQTFTTSAIMSFREDIGISGVKHCCGASVPIFRRILWIFVIFTGLSVMTWQMADRIFYYFTYEVNVVTEIKYFQQIDFPAVIVCNHNMYKRSKLEENGYGGVVHDTFSSSQGPDYSSLNLTDFNSTEFHIKYAQPLKDIYYLAIWESSLHIPIENFTMTLNKFGVCFTFNGDGNLKVANSGSPSGLVLYFMVQQNESFSGPRISSGLQVLAYKPRGVPLVTELGYAASVGFNTRIGLRVIETKNLRPPWGICDDSKELEFFESYSYEACRLECETRYMVQQCGCKLFYMPGNARPCDLKEMYECGGPNECRHYVYMEKNEIIRPANWLIQYACT